MNRQYIGARYVPKFFVNSLGGNEWVDNVAYEPLTIVTYLNNSYTSKKPVPANSGNPIDRSDLWVNTGNYNAQFELFRQEFENTILTNKLIVGEPIYIFIGDSYDQYSGWVGKTASALGLNGNQVVNLAQPSSNLSSGGWLSFLTTWVNNNQDKLNRVKYVICGGGINDSDEQWAGGILTALQNFCNYVKANLPQAEALFSYFGYALPDSSIVAGRNYFYRDIAQGRWSMCGLYGGRYIKGCEAVLHDSTLIGADGLHPNPLGGDAIAKYLSNAIKNGSSLVNYSLSNAPIEIADGTKIGDIQETIYDGMYSLYFNGFGLTGGVNQIIMAGGNAGTVGIGKCKYAGSINAITLPITYVTSDDEEYTLNTEITFPYGYLQFRILERRSNGEHYSFYVKEIKPFSASITMPVMLN